MTDTAVLIREILIRTGYHFSRCSLKHLDLRNKLFMEDTLA